MLPPPIGRRSQLAILQPEVLPLSAVRPSVQARNTSRANCSGLSDSSEEEDAPAPEPALKVLPQSARHTARHESGQTGWKLRVADALIFEMLRPV